MDRLNLEALLQNGNQPRLHPDGFIQFDIDDARRFHVWPEEPLLRRSNQADIHDHVFRFQSEILIGSLTEHLYQPKPDPGGDYEVFQVVPHVLAGAASKPERILTRRHSLKEVEIRTHQAGDTYELNSRVVHKTRPNGLTATIMTYHIDPECESARIFRRRDQEEPGYFNRDAVPIDRLWEQIENVLRELK